MGARARAVPSSFTLLRFRVWFFFLLGLGFGGGSSLGPLLLSLCEIRDELGVPERVCGKFKCGSAGGGGFSDRRVLVLLFPSVPRFTGRKAPTGFCDFTMMFFSQHRKLLEGGFPFSVLSASGRGDKEAHLGPRGVSERRGKRVFLL